MRYSAQRLSHLRTAVVAVFLAGMLSILGFLYVEFGGSVPGVTGHGYKLVAQFTDIQNLVPDGDVEMAGVPVGKVQSITRTGGHLDVTMVLDRNAPIHRGATVQIRPKTTLNETYVQIFDGNGAALPTHSTLSLAAVRNDTTFNDVLNTLNAPTRASAQKVITELQAATAAQGDNLNQIIGALGDVGRNGGTVYDILANQSNDLQQLVKQTATLMGVLDEGRGQIAQLTTSAQQVNQTTAAAQASVAATVQALPGLMQSIQGAAPSVQQLSNTLEPIAQNLQAAAPDLNNDLVQLPPITRQLRAVLPTLQGTLQEAPATLVPVRATATDLDQLNPSLAYTLANIDPSVAYLAPYRRDIAAFFSNFGAAVSHQDPNCPAPGPDQPADPSCATYTISEAIFSNNSPENPTQAQQSLQPPLQANGVPAPNQNNPTGSSPQPPPPSYTPVQRLNY